MKTLSKSKFLLHLSSIFKNYFILSFVLSTLFISFLVVAPFFSVLTVFVIFFIMVLYYIFTVFTFFIFLLVPEYRAFHQNLIDYISNSGELLVKFNNLIIDSYPYILAFAALSMVLSLICISLSKNKPELKSKIKFYITFSIILAILGALVIGGGNKLWLI